MKKIFLLTLLSVFFLSAFSQTPNGVEILAKISIDRSAEIGEFEAGELQVGIIGDDPQMVPGWPWWWPFYREVIVDGGPGWMTISCTGRGWKLCIPSISDLIKILKNNREIQPEVVSTTVESLFLESEELVFNGENSGSISKKIAIPGDKTNYFLFQMNWNYDPKNIYTGQAEIIISQTEKFGF